MMKRLIIFFIAVSLGLTACNKEDSDGAEQAEIDNAIIQNYLADHDLTAQETTSGLYYIIDNQGTGVRPTINSTVTVKYKGELIDGRVFDDPKLPISFPLSNVIKGWQEGIPLFNAGGTGTLIVPSCLGYGTNGNAKIPANSVLIFEVYLISAQ